MVKSVLITDADYLVELERELDAGEEAELKKELALQMDLKLRLREDGSTSLVGQGLIWGIQRTPNLQRQALAFRPPVAASNNAKP